MPLVTPRPGAPMGPPPILPAGLPVTAGATAVKQAFLHPTTPQRGASSMPPPSMPVASARPSHSSDGSRNSGRSPAGSYEERSKPPLQESMGADNVDVDTQFEDLLDQLEVPSSVRIKFATVNKSVKASILSSSMTSNPALLATLGLPPPTNGKKQPKNKASTAKLRKAKSSTALKQPPPPSPRRGVGSTCKVQGEEFVIVAGGFNSQPGKHGRGYSVDLPSPNPPYGSRPSTPRSRPSSIFMPQSPSRRGESIGPSEQPGDYVQWLSAFKGTDINMDVNKAKKLRMLLRHETTGWVAAFLDAGGYARVLDRLQDLLDVEWREEQHDDQMLYELLRCVKALGTSEVGKQALRAAHPRPLPALSALLFSEKKPGDLACRQIIVELFLFQFELYNRQPPSPVVPTCRPATPVPTSFNVTYFVRQLLLPEAENKAKDYHDFVQVAHRPRIFKAWVQELSDISRDYFWIMCHANNSLWELSEVDEKLVERPVAPGGATGGVEFEAMGYVTNQFKLINSLAASLAEENPADAHQLHQDLMMSGMDRILITMRRASTTYYPTLHLELARYVEIMRVSYAGKLPYIISKLVGPPPEEVRRHRSASEWLPRLTLDSPGRSPRRAHHS
ncbi:hypothetical protein CC85DRAFT_284989 [Cutaneotrichosporon oleaginosum]|uniref:Formin GTPase-binding domain-containing protein n=1 Tax=Cutaneotrichosporon oleaginosum TaxID=879819 RepID=A0A0J0XPI3_9TREE|nr:uncharacterized protein CC85DRAFT_284989 [Cutaneotrichosporon oleaginosum]KLT43021.1 hypothetical protein CC85DRAFT_284989 [Cutaneotrichosporon oleaginosum]TXT11776.1 hypothetical protein COLE_02186 [Cutaneotrichosporon oleaginosum]